MALFKIFNNIDNPSKDDQTGETILPKTYNKGYMYFDANTNIFYLDTAGTGGQIGTRVKVNAWGATKAAADDDGNIIKTTYLKKADAIATAIDNILEGSHSGTQIAYAPYSEQQSKLSFDTSNTAPTRTDRLNLNGYLYATKLYSGGNEVLTSHSLAGYLPLAGGTMTGSIKHYYSTSDGIPTVAVSANNKDAIALWMGHGTSAGNPASNYYKLIYKGSGGSPNNYFQLVAAKGSDSEVVAMQVNEEGNVSFANTVAASISGNAATATKVSHKLTFGSGTYVFDGSADVTVPLYDGSYTLNS